MNLNIQKIGETLKAAVLQAPVELAESVFFFFLYECTVFKIMPEPEVMHELAYFPIIFFLSLAANTFFRNDMARWRWVYYASAVMVVPIMAIPLEQYTFTTGYFFGILLSVFVLLLSARSKDNAKFAEDLTILVINVILSVVATSVSALALSAIFGTISFIFSFWTVWYRHIPLFLYLIVLPMVFSYFSLSKADKTEWMVPKFVNVMINYIVCPAVIIYTIILYVYLIKIAIMWELPKGGLAAMTLAFYIVALGGKLFQYVAPLKYYKWFYDNFHYISMPLMVLFWVGLLYRINEYSFTESRVYLVAAGVAMMLFSLMMITRRLTNFRLMLIIASGIIVLFTYIPGISAKSIGIKCQLPKMIALAKQLNAYDEASGKLKTDVLDSIDSKDPRLSELVSCYIYLENNIGGKKMLNEYGKYSAGQYIPPEYEQEDGDDKNMHLVEKSGTYEPIYVDCGNYHYLLKTADIVSQEDGIMIVSIYGREILREKINIDKIKEAYKASAVEMQLPDDVFVLRNDSVMVTLYYFTYDGKIFRTYNKGAVFSTKPIKE